MFAWFLFLFNQYPSVHGSSLWDQVPQYHIGNTMKNIGPGCASTGARMYEYTYPDVRVQVPGCASTGTRMCEYRYPDVGVQVPGCGSTGTLDVGVQVRMGQIFSAELLRSAEFLSRRKINVHPVIRRHNCAFSEILNFPWNVTLSYLGGVPLILI